MQITFFIFYFIYALYWVTLTYLVTNVGKISKPVFTAIFILIMFSLIPDTGNLYNVIHLISSQLPSLLYSTCLPFGVYYIYHRNKIIATTSILLLFLFLIHLTLAIITVFNLVELGEFEGLLNFSANIFATGFSVYHFYKLFKSLEVPNLLHNSLFWVSTALFSYNAGTIFLQILQPVFTELDYFYVLWPFYQVILIGYIFVDLL